MWSRVNLRRKGRGLVDRSDFCDRLSSEHLPAYQTKDRSAGDRRAVRALHPWMELANAYTELNDPSLQEQLFRTQLEGMAEEDSMAKMDTDFVRALRHGMPPAGGLGNRIDRLIMLITNARSIRDVILFPLLRHEV